jgi:hypothetical protein
MTATSLSTSDGHKLIVKEPKWLQICFILSLPPISVKEKYKSFQNIYIFNAQAWNVINNRNLQLEYDPDALFVTPSYRKPSGNLVAETM